jgi:hypothetical protein
MVKNIIFLIIIFYFLAIFQMSFLAHFRLCGLNFNFLLIVPVLLNLLEKSEGRIGLAAALTAGFFLDLSLIGEQTLFFGFYTLISLLLSLFVKMVIRNYVKIPNFKGVF